MSRSVHRRIMLILVGAIAVLALAACGSSSSSSSSASSSAGGGGSSSSSASSSASSSSGGGGQSYLSPGPTGGGIRPGTGSYAAKAVAAGQVAAKDAGKPKKPLPTITVGVINFLNGIESSDRLADTATYAASQLGWKTIVCDGKGTPTQFVACGDSLLNQGVKAIIAVAVEPGQMQEVISKAKSMNVPVIQTGGGAVPPGFSGNYGPNEQEAGKLLSDAVIKKLDALPGNPSVVIHNFPSAWAAQRTLQFTNALKGQSKIKVAANVTTDAANLVPFTRNAVSTEITQDPNAKAYWFTFDTTGQVGGGVLAAKYAGKSFPDRPLVVTFHADLGTLQLMRQGKIDMTSEANYDAATWEAMNAIAELLTNGTTIPQANQPTFPVIGDPFTYQIVDKSNLPPAGQYVQPKWDVPSYFIAKWKAEFGK
ncbi:MAG TPA: substrate-binding domain-containing protein [Solirubrobacteraceae bacterium]|nr:substrate-binding domain-containing protein [Solirubrobacteraceae bacterium]